MKILISGMNKNQITENFYLRQQLSVVPSHYSLIRCLRAMGHTVEQRLVKIGEDLSAYDQVIVFLASPRQALQLAFYNGLWAIHQRPNCILAFDDWQVEDIYKGIASCFDAESLLKEFTIGQNKMCDPDCSLALLVPHTEALLNAVKQITSKTNPLLLSVFAGGDLSKLIDYPKDLVISYNPNPFHRNRVPGDYGDVPFDELSFLEQGGQAEPEADFVPPEKKEMKLNFASLVQGKTIKWLKKQGVSKWEIEYFGSRKEKQRRLTEGEMCRVYAQQWGCLMPGYPHTSGTSSSGWWRARPLQVADAGSILIGEYAELMLLYGNKHLASLKVSDLEKMTVPMLAAAAKAQRDALYSRHPLDKAKQVEELSKLFLLK